MSRDKKRNVGLTEKEASQIKFYGPTDKPNPNYGLYVKSLNSNDPAEVDRHNSTLAIYKDILAQKGFDVNTITVKNTSALPAPPETEI